MLNLTKLCQIERHAKDDDRAIVSIRLETFSQLLDIAEAAQQHRDSFHNAQKESEVDESAYKLDELLEDVEIGDA